MPIMQMRRLKYVPSSNEIFNFRIKNAKESAGSTDFMSSNKENMNIAWDIQVNNLKDKRCKIRSILISSSSLKVSMSKS